MLRIQRRLPTLACILFGLSACVSTPKVDSQARPLARSASQEEDWPRAMELWNGILVGQRGKDPEARLRLGEALLESDRGLTAIRVLRAEPPVAGTELEYGILLARAHFSVDQVRAGGQVLSELLKDHADDLEVLQLYGRALLGGDREARGLGLLLQALRIDAGDGALAVEVAQRAHALGLADMEGEAWSLRLRAPEPPAEAYLGAVDWEWAKAKADGTELPPDTLPSLQRASQIDPLNSEVWTRIGQWHANHGQAIEARQAYRKAVEVDPGNTEVCYVLAQMYVALDDCKQAKIWIEHALGVLDTPQERERFEELKRTCGDS